MWNKFSNHMAEGSGPPEEISGSIVVRDSITMAPAVAVEGIELISTLHNLALAADLLVEQ